MSKLQMLWRLQTVWTCTKSLKTSRNGEHVYHQACTHIHTCCTYHTDTHSILNFAADFRCVRKLLQNTWRPSVWPFHDSTSSPPLTSWTSSPMATNPLWYDYLHTVCTADTTDSNMHMHNTRCDIKFVLIMQAMWFYQTRINNTFNVRLFERE